jgi:hypothetical protein
MRLGIEFSTCGESLRYWSISDFRFLVRDAQVILCENIVLGTLRSFPLTLPNSRNPFQRSESM